MEATSTNSQSDRHVPELAPVYQIIGDGAVDTDQVNMGMAIMIVMLTIAGLSTLIFKASSESMLKGTIMRSGVSTIISIIGVSWVGWSFYEGNRSSSLPHPIAYFRSPITTTRPTSGESRINGLTIHVVSLITECAKRS